MDENFELATTRYGKMRLPKTDSIIGRALREYGEWAHIEISHLLQFIRPGDVVLDVGACFGTHTLAFAERVGFTGRVFSCEASEINFKYLEFNVSACLSHDCIETIQAVVGRSPDKRHIIQQDDKNYGATSVRAAGEGVASVPAITVDSLGLERLDFMKIDVEGMEADVLAGAVKALSRLRPVVFFEANSVHFASQTMREVSGYNYQFFGDIVPAFNPDNFNKTLQNMFGEGAECGIFAIPTEKVSDFSNEVTSLKLPAINNEDDIALLLMHKPQYFDEILKNSSAATVLNAPGGVMFQRDIHAIRELRDECEQRSARIAMLEVQVADLSAKSTMLEGLLSDARSQLIDIEASLTASRAQSVQLEANLTAARALIAQLEADTRTRTQLVADLKRRIYLSNMLVEHVSRAPFSLYFEAHPRFNAVLRELRPSWPPRRQRNSVSAAAGRALSVLLAKYADKACAKSISGNFERAWYLKQYPDVAAAKIDPLLHYVWYGALEGRKPAAFFDGHAYLEANSDVHASGLNPFYHWVCYGKHEGRQLRPRHAEASDSSKSGAEDDEPQIAPLAAEAGELLHPIGFKADILTHLKNKSEPSYSDAAERVISISALRISELCRSTRGIIISFSHDNYIDVAGGTQLCIGVEQRAALAEGFDYVHAFPIRPASQLAGIDMPDDAPCLGVSLNGKLLGIASYETLSALATLKSDLDVPTHVIVHHAMGHKLEGILAVVSASGSGRCTWWLHDFFVFCESPHLLRNNITFCSAPSIDSMSCGICAYKGPRQLHSERILAFFRSTHVVIVAPSNFVADLFRAQSTLPYEELSVRPHLTIDWHARRMVEFKSGGPVRIAYVGTPAAHKGWPHFVGLATRFRNDPRYTFQYFGSHEPVGPFSSKLVSTSGDDPLRMVGAIREAEIDIVVHVSPTPETFSFTTHEAIAAGAMVLTNRGSGNTALVVESMKRGIVIEGEDELSQLFESGEILLLAAEARIRRSAEFAGIKLSRMSVDDLLGAGEAL